MRALSLLVELGYNYNDSPLVCTNITGHFALFSGFLVAPCSQ